MPPYSGGHGTCSPAHHPARPRVARPHPVRRHHPLEVLPRRGVPDAGGRGPAVHDGASVPEQKSGARQQPRRAQAGCHTA